MQSSHFNIPVFIMLLGIYISKHISKNTRNVIFKDLLKV